MPAAREQTLSRNQPMQVLVSPCPCFELVLKSLETWENKSLPCKCPVCGICYGHLNQSLCLPKEDRYFQLLGSNDHLIIITLKWSQAGMPSWKPTHYVFWYLSYRFALLLAPGHPWVGNHYLNEHSFIFPQGSRDTDELEITKPTVEEGRGRRKGIFASVRPGTQVAALVLIFKFLGH